MKTILLASLILFVQACGTSQANYTNIPEPVICAAIGNGFYVVVTNASNGQLICDATVTVEPRNQPKEVLTVDGANVPCRYPFVNTGTTGEVIVTVEKSGFTDRQIKPVIPSNTCNTEPFEVNGSLAPHVSIRDDDRHVEQL